MGIPRTFHGLFWTQLDQLRAAEGDSTNVGKYVVRNNQGYRDKEPDHAFKDVVDDKMRLYNDEV